MSKKSTGLLKLTTLSSMTTLEKSTSSFTHLLQYHSISFDVEGNLFDLKFNLYHHPFHNIFIQIIQLII